MPCSARDLSSLTLQYLSGTPWHHSNVRSSFGWLRNIGFGLWTGGLGMDCRRLHRLASPVSKRRTMWSTFWCNVCMLGKLGTEGSWWLEARLQYHKQHRKEFDTFVVLTCWSLWKQRNARAF